MKVLSVVGARPQLIKAAVVSRALREKKRLRESVVHTGQHWDHAMKAQILDELQMAEPDHALQLTASEPAARLAEMIQGIERAVLQESPDALLVYGDTTSTLAGAMVSAMRAIPLVHVEAGQRSGDFSMPEERNRVTADHLSRWLFCCAPSNVAALKREGIERGVHLVGDVMFDAYLQSRPRARWPQAVTRPAGDFAVLTLHRAANVDDPVRLRRIVDAVAALDVPIIFPVHPRTQVRLREFGISLPPSIIATGAVGYLETLALLEGSHFVLTDSGGLQKEAYYADRPCAVFRDQTEWPELIHLGASFLVGADGRQLMAAYAAAKENRKRSPSQSTPYGAGDSATQIAEILSKA